MLSSLCIFTYTKILPGMLLPDTTRYVVHVFDYFFLFTLNRQKQTRPTKKSKKEATRAERLSLLPSESFSVEEDLDMGWDLSEDTLHHFLTDVATAKRRYRRGESGGEGIAAHVSPSQCWTASD